MASGYVWLNRALHPRCVSEKGPSRFSYLLNEALILRILCHFILIKSHLILSFLQKVDSLQIMITFVNTFSNFFPWLLGAINATISDFAFHTSQSIIEGKLAPIKIFETLRIESSRRLVLALIRSTGNLSFVSQKTLCILRQDLLLHNLVIFNRLITVLDWANGLVQWLEVTKIIWAWLDIVVISKGSTVSWKCLVDYVLLFRFSALMLNFLRALIFSSPILLLVHSMTGKHRHIITNHLISLCLRSNPAFFILFLNELLESKNIIRHIIHSFFINVSVEGVGQCLWVVI